MAEMSDDPREKAPPSDYQLIGPSEDGQYYTNGIFIHTLQNFFGIHPKATFLDRDFVQFDIEIVREFMPANLNGTRHNIWLIRKLAIGLPALEPFPFKSKAAKH